MRGVIETDINGQFWAKVGNCRGDMICGGGADESMKTAVGGRADRIVYRME